jgi:alpha-tubulin suppressor-like RCC1 family protein
MAIEAGQGHSLAIKTNGTLWAWGFNYYGQLGIGDTTNVNVPTQIGTDNNWMKISAGGGHSLALKTDSTLWAWGANEEGQLGNDTTIQSTVPVQIGANINWSDVSAGFEFSLGRQSDNTIWSWGFNGNGQLGIDYTVNTHVPNQIGTDNNWVKIAASSAFAFAIKSDSTLYGWGYNGYGQLGTSDNIQQTSPIQIGIDNNWTTISAADGFIYNSSVYGYHSLGLKNPQNVICATGANYVGQLGDNSTINENLFNCATGLLPYSGLYTINKESDILFYPNPANDNITIENSDIIKDAMISIYNIHGQLLIQQPLRQTKTEINISKISKGLYILKIGNQEGIAVKRFIKE